MCNEVCFTANMYVSFMWTAPQAFIKCSTVSFLFAAIKFTNKDIVCSEDFIFAISAKPGEKKNFKIKNWVCHYFIRHLTVNQMTTLPSHVQHYKKPSYTMGNLYIYGKYKFRDYMSIVKSPFANDFLNYRSIEPKRMRQICTC